MIKKLIILANKLDELGFFRAANLIDELSEETMDLSSFDKPIIQTSPGKDNESVIIEWLNIPEHQRGKGLGKETYHKWEKELPPNIKNIYLYAADLGSGSSVGFWKSLGFEVVDDSSDTPLMKKIRAV